MMIKKKKKIKKTQNKKKNKIINQNKMYRKKEVEDVLNEFSFLVCITLKWITLEFLA